MSQLLPETIELKAEKGGIDLSFWQEVFRKHHDIRRDHRALLETLEIDNKKAGPYFDSLRRVYADRFEYERYRLSGGQKKQPAIARGLGFVVR
ncbi:MAG: hypothetical protein GY770_25930 [Aestuariibacter sp.]|nr:hypothetical protein [Aestuariibacter sp.]